ncbi:hypothetical protein MY7_0593 [Bacillus sp. 5B6]|nr:hypothetical protein MY7_0593 [Bacillus sp. 5B6]
MVVPNVTRTISRLQNQTVSGHKKRRARALLFLYAYLIE